MEFGQEAGHLRHETWPFHAISGLASSNFSRKLAEPRAFQVYKRRRDAAEHLRLWVVALAGGGVHDHEGGDLPYLERATSLESLYNAHALKRLVAHSCLPTWQKWYLNFRAAVKTSRN